MRADAKLLHHMVTGSTMSRRPTQQAVGDQPQRRDVDQALALVDQVDEVR